jgi:hypothetical protein
VAKEPAKEPAKKSARKGGSARRKPAADRDAPAVDPVSYGLLLAAVVAGPPLWALYRAGDIELVTFLLHGGLVAVGCGVGINAINGLIAEYRRQADREQRIQQMMDAIDDVVHEGLPISPAAPDTSSPQPASQPPPPPASQTKPPPPATTPDRPDRQSP